jgi:phosphate transport system substrate-binding protein
MNLTRTISLLFCIAIFCGCKPRKSEKIMDTNPAVTTVNVSGNFTISGAYALYPLVRKWRDDFIKIHSGVIIGLETGGTGQGLEDLLSKKSQLAMISRPMTDEDFDAGIWTIPVAKDGVAAIVNQENPYIGRIMDQGLSPEELLKVFTGNKPLTWGELLDTSGNEKVLVFTRTDESGAAEVFADFLNKEASDFKGTGVNGDDEMIKNVQKNPLAIGFCNFSYAFDASTGERIKNIQMVPADIDYDNKIDRTELPFSNLEKAHRSLWLGLYPKRLCRELSIGSVGKPTDEAVIEFLKYVLTEGQKDIKTAGLCELNDVYVGYALDKLK